MLDVNNAIQLALDVYDRPDLESQLKRRVRGALFELHGAALFAQDLAVSSPVVYTKNVEITYPSNLRIFNRIVAYVDGDEAHYEFKESSVLNPQDYYQFAEPRYFMRRGNVVLVSCEDVPASQVAIEYYKYPSFDSETLATDSWIPEDILASKLTAITARLAGKQDDVNGYERKAMEALDTLYGG